MIEDVTIHGFDYGVRVGTPEFGVTFENVIISDYRKIGLWNRQCPITARHLTINGPSPAILSERRQAHLILLDSKLETDSQPTIDSEGALYLRNVDLSAAEANFIDDGQTVAMTYADEYLSGNKRELFPSGSSSLGLPVAETPEVPEISDNNIAVVQPRYYGDRQAFATALQSGKPIIGFPAAGHLFHVNNAEEVYEVPAAVERITAMHGVINTNGTLGLRLLIEDDADTPLVIDRFGYGITILHRSPRPLVLRHGIFRYEAEPGAGPVYAADVQMDNLTFMPGQNVWFRQLNTEGQEEHIHNQGGNVWIFGVKTERKGTVVRSTAGAQTEVLGNLLYPLRSLENTTTPAFIVENSRASFIYSKSHYSPPETDIGIHVRETRNGITRDLSKEVFDGRHMNLFTAYQAVTTNN